MYLWLECFLLLFLVCVCCLFLEINVFDWRLARTSQRSSSFRPFNAVQNTPNCTIQHWNSCGGSWRSPPPTVSSALESTGSQLLYQKKPCVCPVMQDGCLSQFAVPLQSHSRRSLCFYTKSFICTSHCFETILYLLLFLFYCLFFSWLQWLWCVWVRRRDLFAVYLLFVYLHRFESPWSQATSLTWTTVQALRSPPPPLPETCASIGVSVMPTLYFDFQSFSVRTAVNSTSQVTSVCHHPKGNLASFSFLFSRASSQMYVVLSKHNYALSIKAIQVDWIWIFFF